MKKFTTLSLLAVAAMLLLPALASAACELSPWLTGDLFGCIDFEECAEVGDQWCDPADIAAGGSVCVATAACDPVSTRCIGNDTGSCGAKYCYCDAPGVNCGCKDEAKVNLLDFSAERGTEGVKLTWKTAQEIECGAFKILRCKTATPGTCELWSHTELDITVPCEGNPNGADYSTVDSTAGKDQSYSYYLREYDTTDRIFEYGPMFISVDDSFMNTGHVEPYESTFDLLRAQPGDDDDDDEAEEEEPEAAADDSDDSEGACGC